MRLFRFFLVFALLCAGGDSAAQYYKRKEIEKKDPKMVFTSATECGGANPIRIVGFKDFPPFSYVKRIVIDKHDKRYKYVLEGALPRIFDKLLVSLRSAKSRVPLIDNEVRYESYDEAKRLIIRGEADVLIGAYYTEDHMSGLDFVYPSYITNHLVAVFKKDKFLDVKGLEELVGLSGAVRVEEGLDRLTEWGNRQLSLSLVPENVNLLEMFALLEKGDKDYILTNYYTAHAAIDKYKLHDKVQITGILRPQHIFVAFSSLSRCRVLKPYLEDAIKELLEGDGSYISRQLNDAAVEWRSFKEEVKIPNTKKGNGEDE